MQKVVGTTADLSPGEMMEAEFNGRSIVVCRASDGEFHAFTNVCPHQGAPLSKGKLCGAPVATEQIGEYDFQHEGTFFVALGMAVNLILKMKAAHLPQMESRSYVNTNFLLKMSRS
ncbi:hypothetical protein JCM19037_2408 [Geomicrobium sp. JCM 19037]|uniref:Rieske (2Fe-2S) protein n=1 Tax=Geomicrobium sp. JCM 19037 TaxID=1460634 RepID=UPI00045F4B84|nr:Rieske (2Fe-2S) protein [Geomicrobium sp. JCM 19037]GAK04037.1 hypothetical protein JCM19037_2408 [Geomicrobium sp. JCM 19037]